MAESTNAKPLAKLTKAEIEELMHKHRAALAELKRELKRREREIMETPPDF